MSENDPQQTAAPVTPPPLQAPPPIRLETPTSAEPSPAFPDEVEMTLVGHLEELRTRILRSLLAVVIAAAGCLLLVRRLVRLLEVPVDVTAGLLLEGMEPLPGQSFVAAEQQLRRYPQVRAEGQVWEVEGWSAAERLQTGWWTDRPCQRDYHVVLVRGGSRLWLYRDLQTGRWYLHGVFD